MNWSRPPPEVFRAVTGQQRAAIWSRVAGSSEEVAAWEQSPHFQTWEELHLYQNVGWWEAVDHEDRPVAIMRLGQAVSQCDTKVSAENLAKAMISLVPRLVRLLTHIATGLNQHKPEKLHRLFFVDLPAAMRWPLQAARPLLHADIRPKVHVCHLHDSALPFDLEAIPASWQA
ncbi:TPA: hypothetical protein ACH3X2_003326 [Trebouxia sp. C0005]